MLPRVSRIRLLDLLRSSLTSCTATLLNGRTGSGKTMLATDFARHCQRRVSWFKVDASDNTPRIFLRSLVDSLRRARASFGDGNLLSLIETESFEDMALVA